MQVKIKSFDELTKEELYEILRLRVDIFVVEQECPYPEIDGIDYEAIHIYLENKGEIQAYARVYEEEGEVHIGRVISKERRKGNATLILKEAIKGAKKFYQAKEIHIEAQTYAKKLYEKVGFVEDSEIYFLDGIEHIKMLLDLTNCKNKNTAENIFPGPKVPTKEEIKKLTDKALVNQNQAEPVDKAFEEIWDEINNGN